MALWKGEFREELSLERAHLEASLLLELYGRLAEPLAEVRPRPDSTANAL